MVTAAIALIGLVLAAPTTAPTPGTSPQPPTAPSDLRVTAVTSGSVTLSWTAATPGSIPLAGYDFTINQAFNDIIRTESVGDVTTATLTAWITPTGQYSIRVAARTTAGTRSLSSNTVTFVTPPSAPTGLRVTAAVPGATSLAWSPSTDDVGVTGYEVYRFNGLYISTLVATVDGTTHTAPPATPSDIWYVRARDAAGNLSAASNIVTAQTPPATCRVTYAVTARWAGGFVADVTVSNTTAVSGWALALTYAGDQRVSSSWNATFTQSGATVTVTGARWNQSIPAGGSASAGLLGSWTTGAEKPSAAVLTGAPGTVT
ncbi:MAG: cellulose binding domain-containing protein [Actinoplanes sp.]